MPECDKEKRVQRGQIERRRRYPKQSPPFLKRKRDMKKSKSKRRILLPIKPPKGYPDPTCLCLESPLPPKERRGRANSALKKPVSGMKEFHFFPQSSFRKKSMRSWKLPRFPKKSTPQVETSCLHKGSSVTQFRMNVSLCRESPAKDCPNHQEE